MKLFIVFCITFLVFYAQAESSYKVGFFEAGLLYHNGVGIHKDIMDELQKRTKITFQYLERPRARIWGELQEGKISIALSGLATPEREQFAWFIPYSTQTNVAIFLKDKAPSYKSAEDFLSHKYSRIAVIRGFKHGPFFDDFIEKLKKRNSVDEVPSFEVLFNMLKKKERIDMVISSPFFYRPYIKEYGLENLIDIKDWDTSKTKLKGSLVLSKKLISEQDKNLIQKTLEEMKKDGTLKKIYLKYVSLSEANAALLP